MEMVQLEDLKSWAQKDQVFLDVRSPGEFEQGHVPGAINLPILDNDERALIGLTYKTAGKERAVRLGYDVVSGVNRERKIQKWVELATQNPDVILTCFRGGLRSQITRDWLKSAGFDRPLIQGGYKACRQILTDKIQQHCESYNFLLVSGPTGAAKTHFLKRASEFWPAIDLEDYANHRGSAFGKMDYPQPQQALFENRIAWGLLKAEDEADKYDLPVLVEDESRLIGRCVQPESFFSSLRNSEIIWLDIPLEQRVENTFLDYIQEPLSRRTEDEQGIQLFQRYRIALYDIRNRLGGARYQDLLQNLVDGEKAWLQSRDLEPNKIWIRKLLQDYYDPMYFSSLEKRNPKVYFKGPTDEALDLLKGAKSKNKAAPVRQKA